MKTPRLAPLFFMCFLLVCAGLYAQTENTEESGRKYKPREQKLYIDIPLTFGEVMLINFIGNGYWRLWGPDSEAAYFTADSMRANLHLSAWSFEKGQGGDTFLTNQFIHPYAGALYFASARSNNISFYWSILSSFLGSFSWEALGETDSPGTNDLINTTFGGVVIGEIIHRLFLEADKGGIAGRIGASFVSPVDRVTAAIRGYGPKSEPRKIYSASLAMGFSWINAEFFEEDKAITSWNRPAVFLNYELVYGDPYTAQSKIPFDQFDLNISFTASFPFAHNSIFIANGFLSSWLLADNDINQASNGVTLHFDVFITDKRLLDLNDGRENLNFNVHSLDYSVKWRRFGYHIFNKPFVLSMKTHIGFSPWAVTDYNGGINRDDYNLYLFGGNIKLFMELRQTNEEDTLKNGQVLALSLCFYDTWNIPKTPGFDVNAIFLFSKLAYSFPLSNKLSLYVADSFLLLYCHLTRNIGEEFPDITRIYNSAQIGLKISF